ncbi:MAG: exonuclease SbcCD subunit D [Chloroflexota bacterium]|nr:exonuclease SbcCD subunit D [Dehalococcoidia bacterium]MDW8253904.1 exonuclease SbcCD subunit D [Chloroflexota bacterium]
MRRLEVLHFSDVHLGLENYSRIDTDTGLPSRLVDCLRALDEVVNTALEEQVDLVLFTGDMYKSRDPSPTHQRELAKRIARLCREGVPLFMLVGNHDLPNSPVRAHSIEVFEALPLTSVYVAGRPTLLRIETKAGPVQVLALPWAPRSRLLRQDEARNLTLDELNQRLVQKLTEFVRLRVADLDPRLPSILAIHAQVYGATFGSERATTLGHDYILSLGDLCLTHFDYVALGHIHKMQQVHDHPPAIYPGSLQRADFSEEGEEKGFLRLSFEPHSAGDRPYTVRWRFVPSAAARRFFTLSVDASQADDPTRLVLKQIEQHADQIQEAVVRVRVRLSSENERQFRVADVRRALREAHYVAAIARIVESAPAHALPDVLAEQLAPLEALELYLKARGVEEARRNVLLEYAARLIAGINQPAF